MKRRLPVRSTPIILLSALVVRLLIAWILPYRDWISDEGEYWGAAMWLAHGRGFQFFDSWIWSRPPLYLLFLAGHIRLFGPTALWAPRLSQALLSVVAVWLTMRVARRLAPPEQAARVARITGWAMALSYGYASFAFLLLSETLFLTLFLAAVLGLLRWSASHRRRELIGAALLLGLCALTRAVVLTWLPLVALWVFWQARQSIPRAGRHWWHGWRALALLTAVVCTVVLPWSAFASARWGGGSGAGLIVVDTTGGYNWALGVQSGTPAGRDEIALHDTLCGGPQCDGAQAARQAQAYALGGELLQKYPGGFVRKTGRELLDMLQLRFGGAERLTSGYTSGAVPALHLWGLLLDDTLYVLALLLAGLGLLRHQQRAGKALVVSWLLYNVALGALVFAINRFRHPLLPFVFIYAACALAQWRTPWPTRRRRQVAWLVTGLLALVVLPSYLYWPFGSDRRAIWQETLHGLTGLRKAADCAQVEQALMVGDLNAARNLHDAADVRWGGLSCLAVLNARILEAEGHPDAALELLHRSSPINAEQASQVLLTEGDLLRRLGRTADAVGVFTPRAVEIVNDTAWAWSHLDPPPATRIDLGAGLDYGYIVNFYTRDPGTPNSRWSGAASALRFPGAGSGAPQTLVLRANGYTLNPMPTQVTPLLGAQRLPPLTLPGGATWTELSIALPPTPPGQDVVVGFESPVFFPGPQDLALRQRDRVRQPLRLLGFQLDWAELR